MPNGSCIGQPKSWTGTVCGMKKWPNQSIINNSLITKHMKYQHVCMLSHFSHVRLSVTLWTITQAPLSIEIMIHTVKGFSVVNEVETVFLEFSCFSYEPKDIGNLISGSSASSKSSLKICKFSIHVLLKPSLKNFEHYLTDTWNECNCTLLTREMSATAQSVVWMFFGITLLWYWNDKDFSSPVAMAEFSKFAGILSAALWQYHLLGFEIVQLEFHHLH